MTINQIYTIYPAKFNILKLKRDIWEKKYAGVKLIGYMESLCYYNDPTKPVSFIDIKATDWSVVDA